MAECTAIEKERLGAFKRYALWALGRLQGLMIVDIFGMRHATRVLRLSQAYIEYLSVVPWNRPTIQEPRHLLGSGSSLLGVARQDSVGHGWKGRMGLHSVPDLNTLQFYQGQHFQDFGPDPGEQGCHYMEFPGIV